MKTRLPQHGDVVRLLCHIVLASMLVTSTSVASAISHTAPHFTEDELQWINAHPVVHIAVEANWNPIEYMHDGKHAGLVAGYLDAISRISGLTFKAVPGTQWGHAYQALKSGKVDLLPGVWRELAHDRMGDDAIISTPYLVGRLTAITRSDSTMIFNLQRLEGRHVAIKGLGAVEYYMRHSCEKCDILTFDSDELALAAVSAGKADVALGVDITILPIVRSQYHGQLFMSGMIADRPFSLAMAARADMPILASIINKSLAAIPASEAATMTRNWVGLADYGKPTIRSILHYRAPLVFALGLMLLGFATLAYLSWKARSAAIRSERDKAMFLAFVSHEIRTPMQTVISSLELLQCSALTGQQANRADLAISASETLLTLLDDLLEYLRLDSRKVTLEPRPVALEEWAGQSLEMVRWRADEKQIELRLETTCPAMLHVVIDPVRVRQIALNLLVNAIKFTPAGSVALHIAYVPDQQDQSGTLVIEVRDTGAGIAPERRKHMFDAYWTAECSPRLGAEGSGLGLAICRLLVDLMHGTITVDSTSHIGTTIAVRLPTSATISPAAMRLPAPVHGPTANARQGSGVDVRDGGGNLLILVVDDHEAVQRSIRQQCKEIGCWTVMASNGEDALRQFTQMRLDMVLLDCDLPDIDGYTLARMIRESEIARQTSHVPIIAISASSGDTHKVRCFESGMDGVLGKPLRLAALRQMIEMWCPSHQVVPLNEPATLSLESSDELREDYIRMVMRDLEALVGALQSGDIARALHAAHRIKGASGIVGLAGIAEIAERIEAQLSACAGAV